MNEVNASDILSATLAVGEVTDCIGQFNSWIPSPTHEKNSFQQVSSIPHHNLQNQAEKTRSINGCRVLHLINGESKNLETLAMFGEKDESGTCTSTGTESAVCVDAGGEYQQHRPRSRSMGLVVTPDTFQETTTSRSHSRDSLGSYGSLADDYQTTGKNESTEETLVEVTCNKFKRLSTRGSESPKSGSESPKSGIESPKSLSPIIQSEDVKSCFIRSRIYDKEIGRKYSFGSQLSSAKRQLSGQEYAIGPSLPIDLTCKRKKSDATSTSLNCLSMHVGADGGTAFNTVGQTNVGFENVGSYFEDQSILKSVLVGMVRKRSHTLSVCSRQDFKNNSSSQETAAATSSGFSLRQRMTLAKRNLGPVTRRTTEHLKRITQFFRSLPDFMKLSANDQRTLISDSVHRLLMLCMAESNQQFVVTPIREEEVASSEEGTAACMEEPTMQFTETVQNYISKCQAMNISSREYSYMKIITLFHTGSRMLENVSLVEKANADAQQHLQSLVQHCYPDDRLRYSKLLLSLYTLFGINCNMLESLFCRHLISNGNGGLQKFILTEFMTIKYFDDC